MFVMPFVFEHLRKVRDMEGPLHIPCSQCPRELYILVTSVRKTNPILFHHLHKTLLILVRNNKGLVLDLVFAV
jgi:hypothetical protein